MLVFGSARRRTWRSQTHNFSNGHTAVLRLILHKNTSIGRSSLGLTGRVFSEVVLLFQRLAILGELFGEGEPNSLLARFVNTSVNGLAAMNTFHYLQSGAFFYLSI